MVGLQYDRYVFFQTADDHVVILPRAMTAAAGCDCHILWMWIESMKILEEER